MEQHNDGVHAPAAIAATSADSVDSAPQESAPQPFYVVATWKFWTLYVATFGLYNLYWFYRNWKQYRLATREEMWPIARGLFNIFFVHSLCELVNVRILRKGLDYSWAYKVIPTVYVVLMIAARICDKLASKEIGLPTTEMLGLALLPFTAWMVWGMQLAINVACDDPDGATNNRLTGLNILWIAIGAIIWLLIAYGMIAPTGGEAALDKGSV